MLIFLKKTYFFIVFRGFLMVSPFVIAGKVLPLQCHCLRRAIQLWDVRLGGTLHNVKASSMLCLLVVWNLRNFNWWSRAMSEVAATGMILSYSGVCAWGYIISSRHTFLEIRATYFRRRQTLYFVHHQGLSQGLKQRTSRGGSLRFAFMWWTGFN